MVRPHRLLATTLAALFLSSAGPGWAQDKKAESEKLKERAFQHVSAGEFKEGVADLEKAFELFPHQNLLFNIAVAYDQWPGHCVETLAAFDRFFVACPSCKAREAGEKRHTLVQERCQPLVKIESEPTGALIEVDDKPIGRAPVEVRLTVAEHALRATLNGHEQASSKITVAVSKPMTTKLTLKKAGGSTPPIASTPPPPPPPPVAVSPPPPPPPSAPPPPPPPVGASVEPAPSGGISTPVIACLGVAGAGVVLGTIFGVLTTGAVSEEETARNERRPITEIESLRSSAVTDSVVMQVSFGVAIVAGGAALVLYLMDDGGAEAPKPSASPATAGAVFTF